MADTLSLYNAVRAVPDDAKKPIAAGRLKGKTDINPMWRIKALTEQFGPCGVGWYYDVTDKRMESYGQEVAAFVDILLYVKVDNEWSRPIFGTGGNMFVTVEKGGPHVSDECFKMALTDAISVACKQLGFGADVYWDADRTKYRNGNDPEGGRTDEKGSQGARRQPPEPKVNKDQISELINECDRTGKSWRAICKMYGVEKFSDMTVSQYQSCMKRFKATPDKAAPPPAAPPENFDDGGLPWSTPER